MRRWVAHARSSARLVADEPWLWLPGALAWLVTVGWIPLVAAVWRPTVSALTYFGSGFFVSGAWPWNAFALLAAALVLAALGFALVAIAETVLLGLLAGRRPRSSHVLRILGIGVITAAPAIVFLLTAGIAGAAMAPAQFNAPDAEPGPLARIAIRLVPLFVALLVAAAAGGALHASAARRAVARDAHLTDALAGGARRLRDVGPATVAHAIAHMLARLTYLAFASLLLIVLWAPIGARLTTGIDAATLLLLVGFVAIWLCLVLGGGAVHAWGSATWTGILEERAAAPRMMASTEAPTRS